MHYEETIDIGRRLLRAREIFAYGGLDGVLKRPLLHEQGTYPSFVVKADGYRLTDISGREYIDWINGWSSVILGHNHPSVTDAIVKQATRATFATLMHPHEMDAAELLIEMLPNAEMVAFGKNGSDSVTAAIRIARAHTGREVILQHGFHGFHDWFVCMFPKAQGILDAWKDYVEPFPYNDLEALETLFVKHADNVAAIVMEPIGFQMPEPGYLAAVKALAHKHGALLIWDEVVTAFRVAKGGAQQYLDVQPDLTVLGKAMGNGMPLSAIVGPRALMQILKSTACGMTFRGETISLAAASACLSFMNSHDVAGHLIETGGTVQSGVNALAKSMGIDCELAGVPSRMAFQFGSQNGRHPRELKSIFVLECIQHGLLTNGNVLPSFAHDDEAVERSMEVFEKGFVKVQQAIEGATDNAKRLRIPHDFSTIEIKGALGGIKHHPSASVLFGWLLVDQAVPDQLQIILEDGTTIVAETVLRQDLAALFPEIENATQAGFRFAISADSGRTRSIQMVASTNGTERYRCLIVDDNPCPIGESGESMGPYSLSDGIVIVAGNNS